MNALVTFQMLPSLVLPCMTHRQGVLQFITAEQIRSHVWPLRNPMS